MESAPPHTPSIVSSRAFWMFFWYSTPQKDRKNKSYFFTAFWRHHRVLTNISLVFPLCPINITNLPLNHHVSRSNPIEITWNHHILIGTIILNHIKSHILWKFQRFSTFFNVCQRFSTFVNVFQRFMLFFLTHKGRPRLCRIPLASNVSRRTSDAPCLQRRQRQRWQRWQTGRAWHYRTTLCLKTGDLLLNGTL